MKAMNIAMVYLSAPYTQTANGPHRSTCFPLVAFLICQVSRIIGVGDTNDFHEVSIYDDRNPPSTGITAPCT